jgi:hypothetical protein
LREEWTVSYAAHYPGNADAESWQVVIDMVPVLIARTRQGDYDAVRAVLENVERLLPLADRAARNLLVIGVIEGLQNMSSGGEPDRDPLVALLGPLGRDAWAAVDASWQGDSERLDLIHSDNWPADR